MKKSKQLTELVIFCLIGFDSVAMVLSLNNPLDALLELWVVIKMIYHNPEDFIKIIHATTYITQALLISYFSMALIALQMALGEMLDQDSVEEIRAEAEIDKKNQEDLLQELHNYRMYFKNERKAKELEEWLRKQEKQKKYPQKTDRTKNNLQKAPLPPTNRYY